MRFGMLGTGAGLLCAALAIAPAASAGVASGAAVWQWQNPQPGGAMLLGVRFLDAATGWAVGAEGTCLKTVDGGLAWQSAGPRTNRWLHGISFPDALHGWVVGHDGAIFATADGGATWAAQNAGPGAPYLKGVDFVSTTVGWAVGKGGTILHTADGGATWARQDAGVATHLEGVDFVSATTGFAVGEGGEILRTRDGGARWRALTSPTGADFDEVFFADALRGCATAPEAGIACTADGGATWALTYLKSPGDLTFDYMHGIQLFPDGTGHAVGGGAWWLTTADYGASWQYRTSGSGTLYAVHAVGEDVWAAGDHGDIVVARGGATDWTSLTEDVAVDRNLFGVDFLADGLTGWAVGSSAGILHSADGGESWTPQTTVGDLIVNAVDAISATHAWAVGQQGTIYRTTNGGADPDGDGPLTGWTRQDYSATEWHALNDVDFLEDGSTTGWAVGAGGTILRTDGGATWGEQVSGTTGDLTSVCFVDALYGWASGQGGMLRTTTGGGDPDGDGPLTGWSAAPGPSANAIHFIDRSQGWAVGNAGAIHHTADGGATWTPQTWFNPGFPFPDFRGVWFADALNGWIVGVPAGSLVLRTVDGGATWDLQSAGCNETLEAIFFSGPARGWAVGLNGAILRFDGPLEADPPATAAAGFRLWNKKAVTVRLAPADEETGVAWTWGRADKGGWRTGRSWTFPVDPDYASTDGKHTLRFFSSDNAGNREALQSVTFGIDTRRPWTKVLLPVTVAQGATATVRFRVNDLPPNGGTADATLLVKNAGGAIVRRSVRKGVKVNVDLAVAFAATLPKGSYTLSVAAVDTARNAQYDQLTQPLTVK